MASGKALNVIQLAVLATCDIRSQMRPLTTTCNGSRSLLIPQKECRIERHGPAHFQKKNCILCIVLSSPANV